VRVFFFLFFFLPSSSAWRSSSIFH
jgi:hypothetical protein